MIDGAYGCSTPKKLELVDRLHDLRFLEVPHFQRQAVLSTKSPTDQLEPARAGLGYQAEMPEFPKIREPWLAELLKSHI